MPRNDWLLSTALGGSVAAHNVFILYQEEHHKYAPHQLVPSRQEEALPTRVVSFLPADTDTLGNVHKFVKQGYSAWLIPVLFDDRDREPAYILDLCRARITGKIARKIA